MKLVKAVKQGYFENDAVRSISERHWNGERPARPEYALANIEYLTICLADAAKYDPDAHLRWLLIARNAIERLGGQVPSPDAK